MTLADLCNVECISGCVSGNKIYFKAKDIMSTNSNLKHLFPKYDSEYSNNFIRNNHDFNSVYVDLSFALEICLKQRKEQVLEFLKQSITNTNPQSTTSTPTSSSKNISHTTKTIKLSALINPNLLTIPTANQTIPQNQQNQTNHVPLPQINPNLQIPPQPNQQNPTRQTIQQIPPQQNSQNTTQQNPNSQPTNQNTSTTQQTPPKKRKFCLDQESKKLVVPSRKLTEKEKQSNLKYKKIDERLQSIHNSFDKEYKEKANIARMNLVSDSEERSTLLLSSAQKRSDLTNSLDNAKKKSQDIMTTFAEMCHLVNLEFKHVLWDHFRQNPQHIIDLVWALLVTNKPKSVEKETWDTLQRFGKCLKKPPSLELQLKTKDELSIADKPWKEITYTLDTNLTAKLDKVVKEVNGLVVEYFGLKQVKNGFMVKIEPLLTAMVKVHLHQLEMRKVNKKIIPKVSNCGLHLDESLKVKISMDGRVLGGMRTVIITLQALNLYTFATQEPSTVFPIGMYVGEENEIQQYISDLLRGMKEINDHGLVLIEEDNDASLGINNVSPLQDFNLPVDFYWVSDLKSLDCISNLLREKDMFCFKCGCTRGTVLARLNIVLPHSEETRNIDHCLPIPKGNIFFCIIHMDERITEYLMKMTLKGDNREERILKSLKEIGMFNSFSFRVKTSTAGDVDEEAMSHETQEYSFMLTGPHCGRIMGCISKVLGFLEKEDPKMWEIWNMWRSIRRWIYLTNEQLQKKTITQVKEFEKQLRDWGEKLKVVKSDTSHIGDYIHILVNHYFTMLITIGSLTPLSGEAVENSHKYDRFLMERSTSRGKKVKGKKHGAPEEKGKKDEQEGKENEDEQEEGYEEGYEEEEEEEEEEEDEYEDYEEDSIPESTGQESQKPKRNDIEGFSYEKIIDHTVADKAHWNDLYQLCQILLKKLRILYLSFTCEDVTFHRMELKTGKKIIKFWSRNVYNVLQKPTFIYHVTSQQNGSQSTSQPFSRIHYQPIARPNTPQNGEDVRDADVSSVGEVSENEIEEMVSTIHREEVQDHQFRSSYVPQDDVMDIHEDTDEEITDSQEEMVEEVTYSPLSSSSGCSFFDGLF